MSTVQAKPEIEYPERDGQPMGETDLHRLWMVRIDNMLRRRYREQRVYVGCDLLLYFEEGNPRKFLVPDHFIVFDCEPGRRRVFKTWDEGRTPEVVIEVTSLSTRLADVRRKPNFYAQIGIREQFLYDPTGEYLSPPLQAFRLTAGQYEPIEPNASGAITSNELDLSFHLESGALVLSDRPTGERLRTDDEAEHEAWMAEHEARLAEQEIRLVAERRAEQEAAARAAAEAEVERLRKLLEEKQTGG